MTLKVKFVIEVRRGSIQSGAVIILRSDTISDRFKESKRFNIPVQKLLKINAANTKPIFRTRINELIKKLIN